MKAFKVIFCKELKRVFSDRKLMISLFVVPALVLLIMYSTIGIFAVSRVAKASSGQTGIGVSGTLPEAIEAYLAKNDCVLIPTNESELRSKVDSGEIALGVTVPDDFEQKAQAFSAPEISAIYDGGSDQSKLALERFSSAVSAYHSDLVETAGGVFPAPIITGSSVTSEKESTGRLVGSIAVMLLVVFLFSSCMQQGVDCVAGEKERGFFSSLLMTPAPRFAIAAGKCAALAVVAVLSSFAIFLGVVGAAAVIVLYAGSVLPQGAAMAELSENVPFDISGGMGFRLSDLFTVLLCMAFMAVLFSAIVMFLSSLAKSVKQANSLVSSVYLVLLLLCYMPIISGVSETAAWTFFVPLYGLINCLISLFAGTLKLYQGVTACLSTLLFTVFLIWLSSKVFSTESRRRRARAEE